MIDSTTSPDAPGSIERAAPVSLDPCIAEGCLRRPEWRIAAVDHDGATIRAWLACREHRGQTTTIAWRVEPAIVEIRQYEGEK